MDLSPPEARLLQPPPPAFSPQVGSLTVDGLPLRARDDLHLEQLRRALPALPPPAPRPRDDTDSDRRRFRWEEKRERRGRRRRRRHRRREDRITSDGRSSSSDYMDSDLDEEYPGTRESHAGPRGSHREPVGTHLHLAPATTPRDDYERARNNDMHAWTRWRTGLNEKYVDEAKVPDLGGGEVWSAWTKWADPPPRRNLKNSFVYSQVLLFCTI